MKTRFAHFTKFFLIVVLMLASACKKSNDNNVGPLPPGNSEYEPDEAGVIMTLAAIAYVSEGEEPPVIKESIIQQLQNTSLATEGNWELAWGPGISGIKDNLIYVAVDSTSNPVSYAVCIRGTNVNSLDDIIQDFQTFHFVPFTYGQSGDSIAKGSMRGLDSLLVTLDPVSNSGIHEFLASIATNDKKKLFITGHSQGGALAPLFTYWFITSSGLIDNFDIETYAFAGPSVNNAIFKTNFMNSIPESGAFHMVANSLDIVPYFWARRDSIVPNNIPAPVPLEYQMALETVDIFMAENHVHYVQLADQINIGSFPPQDTLGNIHPSQVFQWYNYWALVQHRHNNYLKLLDVPLIE